MCIANPYITDKSTEDINELKLFIKHGMTNTLLQLYEPKT